MAANVSATVNLGIPLTQQPTYALLALTLTSPSPVTSPSPSTVPSSLPHARYAEQSHPHAVEYNCAQRAHQHVLEQTPMLLTLLGIGSLEYPLTSGVAAVLFSFSKIVGNVFGYSRGRSSAKNRGAFGYLGLLTLVGLVGLVGLRRAGKVDVFTSKIEDAVEAAKPIVNITLAKTYEAVEAAKPHVAKAREVAAPYLVHAYEAAVPYYEAAVPYVEPHVTKAREAAAPYMASALEAAAPYVEPCSDAIANAFRYASSA